jgi:preprotein translocase SecE subunit
VYKQGQGTLSRFGAVALGVLVGIYAGHCWYYWHTLIFFPSARLIGAVALFFVVAAGALYLVLFRPVTSDYLIDMDTELRKVVWPPVMPLFDPKTEAWGSTYVVIVCTIVLTVFIWLVDLGLDFTITRNLLQLLM